MKKNILLYFVLGFLLAGCMARPEETQSPSVSVEIPEYSFTEAPAAETEAQTLPRDETYLLSFVGDCTFGCGLNHVGVGYAFPNVVGDHYRYPFENVISIFEEDDMTFINLEGVLSDTGNPREKRFNFRGPQSYVNILTENSLDFACLGNNHTMDYGMTGYENTRNVLKEAEIPFVERDHSRIVTLDGGLKIGLYSVVYYLIDQEEMQAAIRDLKEQADLVILAAHWGGEGSYYPTKEQVQKAHAAIDAGADFVWGHHTHVLQNMEKYKDGIICYSLGNFSFGGNIYPEDFDTAIVQLEVTKDPQGNTRISNVNAIPCSLSSIPDRNDYRPTPYEKNSEGYRRVVSKLDDTWEGHNIPINRQG